MTPARKLNREFYLRPTLEVARDLIGKYLLYDNGAKLFSARLVEVEAYIGEDDPACHAAVGKTERNRIMFGIGGHAYIYFIYGMYYCLNVVTEQPGFPAAVLLRGAEPDEGIEYMKKNFPRGYRQKLANGPGKLCRAFGLTRRQNGIDLTGQTLYLEDRGYRPGKIVTTPRIGITRGVDRLWRFLDASSMPIVTANSRKFSGDKNR